MTPYYEHAGITIYHGDCRDVLPALVGVDAVATDPPYGLGFMGNDWDRGVPGVHFWDLVLKTAKPGSHLLAFGGTRTFHRLTCAIEDAGFEIRDCLMWVYGSGFPKSHDISKAIDKAAGAEREVVGANPNHRPVSGVDYAGIYQGANTGGPTITAPATAAARQWEGWGTALKPAWEPIILARKPLIGTVAENVLEHGTGGLNVDGCRVETSEDFGRGGVREKTRGYVGIKSEETTPALPASPLGRWPANLIHDGSDEVVGLFPVTSSGSIAPHHVRTTSKTKSVFGERSAPPEQTFGDTGSAARFFFCASWSDAEVLFSRAKAILAAWKPSIASSADPSSALSSRAVASVLSRAATVASHGAIRASVSMAPSTSATASECALLCENVIAATLSLDVERLPVRLLVEPIPFRNPAKDAGPSGQTGTTTTTASRLRSVGCAASVTFSTTETSTEAGDQGSASRVFYCAKASASDRGVNSHPTVKPLSLMKWLVRLVTPPRGLVLDPFMGSGSTLRAAKDLGLRAIGIEIEERYCEIAAKRLSQEVIAFEPPESSPAPSQETLL